MLVGDVRDEGPRIAIRPQPRAGLVPDEVALGHEPGRIRPRGQVRSDELVPTVLVSIAHDDDRVAAGTQDSGQLDEDGPHPVEIGRVVVATEPNRSWWHPKMIAYASSSDLIT